MKTVQFSTTKWRELALTYKPKTNFDRVMHDSYGLKRVIVREDMFGHHYQIVDEHKYLVFLLEWS